jgi:hypothetical protein
MLTIAGSAGPSSLDPARFILQGSSNGEDWETVGSSTWTRHSRGFTYTQGRFDVMLERNAPVYLDMRPHGSHIINLAVFYIKSLGFVLAGLAGYLERAKTGQWFIVVAFLLSSACHFACGALRRTEYGIDVDQRGVASALPMIEGAVSLLFALLVVFVQRRLVFFQALTAISFIILLSITYITVYSDADFLGLSVLGDCLLLASCLIVAISTPPLQMSHTPVCQIVYSSCEYRCWYISACPRGRLVSLVWPSMAIDNLFSLCAYNNVHIYSQVLLHADNI